MRDAVQHQAGNLQYRASGAIPAPHYRANPRRQFRHFKRFGHELIRTRVKPAHAIFHHIRARHHQHLLIGFLRADASQRIQPHRPLRFKSSTTTS